MSYTNCKFHQLYHLSFLFPTLEQLCLLPGAKTQAKTLGKCAVERYLFYLGSEVVHQTMRSEELVFLWQTVCQEQLYLSFPIQLKISKGESGAAVKPLQAYLSTVLQPACIL